MLIGGVLVGCFLATLVYLGGSEALHLNITSIEVKPYLSKNENGTTNGTTVEYEGYLKDLLEELADAGGFTYDLNVREDGQYGRLEGDKWTGMIGDVVDERADLAAAPLTITMDREAVVDFTYPFVSFEAVAVMAKRHPDQEPVLRSFEDIVNSEDIEVGVTKHSTMSKVLQNSNNELAQKVWKDITLKPSSFKKSNQEGINEARANENFAFLIEGVTADWVLRKEPCDLMSFDTGLYRRKYAFAVKNGSPLRDQVNMALVDVQHAGTSQELYDKWWGENECSSSYQLKPCIALMLSLVAAMFAFMKR